jgi:hypothetical protein
MLVIAALTDQLVTVVLGFALTTVVGGVLGSWFQRRTWDHQNERTLAEADRAHATQICREVSQLMDKRLYRMLQLDWAFGTGEIDRSRVDARMDDYRGVLYKWNDTLNRTLAATETVFGHALRDQLEADVYEGFRSSGLKLEERYRALAASPHSDSGAPSGQDVGHDLREMRERIYAITVKMLRQIRDGTVGRNAPD